MIKIVEYSIDGGADIHQGLFSSGLTGSAFQDTASASGALPLQG